jgi:hypothetical protein
MKLEIEGYVDPAQDKEGLQKAELSRLIKTQKVNEVADKGQTPAARAVALGWRNRTGANIYSQVPVACPRYKRKGEGQSGRV